MNAPGGVSFRAKRDPREIRVIATKSKDSAALSGGQCSARFHSQLKKWVSDPKHDNVKLLIKIDAALDSLVGVSFHKVETNDPYYLAAKRLADDAVGHRAKLESPSAELDEGDEGEFELVEDFDWLMQRAMSRHI
jgi:hypothetical protein